MDNPSSLFSLVSEANIPSTAISGSSSQIEALLAEQMAVLDIDETPMAHSAEEVMVDCQPQ